MGFVRSLLSCRLCYTLRLLMHMSWLPISPGKNPLLINVNNRFEKVCQKKEIGVKKTKVFLEINAFLCLEINPFL